MFGNLIESKSHSSEFARRGYFLLGTILTYSLLIVAGAVGSVYAYDAHLESQNLEMFALVSPVMPTEQKPEPQREQSKNQNRATTVPVRTTLISQIANNTKIPDHVSTEINHNPEVPNGPVRLGSENIDPVGPVGPIGDPGPTNGQPHVIDDGTPPPVKVEPTPEVKRIPPVISKGPVTGQAISLPKPVYPQVAKATHTRGAVKVQVLIDETGKVVSAQVLEGPPLLRATSEQAAWKARFGPTMLGGVAVKVSGYIVYNFSE